MAFELADHEDTFPDANKYAASRVPLVELLKACRTKDEARKAIEAAQERYSELFDAFQAGVKLAREIADDKCPDCRVPGGDPHKPGCAVPRLGEAGRAGPGSVQPSLDLRRHRPLAQGACPSCGVPRNSVHAPGCNAI